MPKRIVVIDGHPDPAGAHLIDALAEAYAEGALAGRHHVERIAVARLDFPVLRTASDFQSGTPPPAIAECQQKIVAADHWAFFYPLWLGDMPALLKAFLEQTFRPTIATPSGRRGRFGQPLVRNVSARIVVTMGMPALAYRLYYRQHSVKSLERNVLNFAGVRPVRVTFHGGVEATSDRRRARWLREMQGLGKRAR